MKKVVVAVFAVLMMCGLAVGDGGSDKVAVFITGSMPGSCTYLRTELREQLEKALYRSGEYGVIERFDENQNLVELEREYQRNSGNVVSDQVAKKAQEFGVRWLCIAKVSAREGSTQNVNVRMVNVNTKLVKILGDFRSPIRSDRDCYPFAKNAGRVLVGGEEAEGVLERKVERDELKKKWRNRVAIGFNVAGLGAVGYGIYKDSQLNARSREAGVEKKEIEDLKNERNTYYVIGAALCATGISIRIFF